MRIRRDDMMVPQECSLANLCFLIELQLRLVTELTHGGHDTLHADAMLRQLLDREASIRVTHEFAEAASPAVSVAA